MSISENFKIFLIILLFSSLIISCSVNVKKADLVLLNGNIITVDSSNTITQAIAVLADTIIAVGSDEVIQKFIGESTKVIDLKEKTVIPGFIDSHAHLIGTGNSKINIDLRTAQNWDEVISLTAEAARNSKPGEWIIGRGWHQEKWNPIPMENVKGFPFHYELSKATPLNPVILSHASGHAIFANQKAMEIANITSETPDPKGGEIIKDINGNPIGVFSEEAEKLIFSKYEEYLSHRSEKEKKDNIKKIVKIAMDECLSKGITSFHDAGTSFEEINVLKEMADSSELNIRLYLMLIDNYKSLKDSLKAYHTIGYGNNHLTVNAIKLYMDGALGSRGAWLLNPYSDSPDQTGLNTTSLTEINNIVNLALENDFQACTHAIGDRGNREILNIYEKALATSNYKDRRWRIEHAQHLSPNDIQRFSKLGVIAAMQSIHCTSDAPFVEKRLGKDRAESGSYIWKSLINSGALICNGTDSPVEDINPINNFYSAVTRKLQDGTEFFPKQEMTRLEALRSYTINGAYAAFEENIKGSIEVGKLADFTILSKDILTIPDDEILSTEVIYTIVGGKILYER